MSLESQLSLNMNGGVYYEGTRVTPTDDPILFVGLGGTGVDALLRIKNEVQTRMPLPQSDDGQILGTSPNNIAFIAMDTDKAVLKKHYGVAGFDASGDEFIDLSVPGLPSVIQSIVERHLNEPEWSWFDKDVSCNGGLDGANGIRQVGRFMLFQRVNLVVDRVTRLIQKVVRASKTNVPKIFIVTGIGGGTGSGTFLDVAYILRELAMRITQTVQIHGFIFTPDLNKQNGGDNTSMYRNGFAALKELDYWMSAGEHHQHFIQKYSNNFQLDSISRPFDYCHIITAQDAARNLVTYSEAMDAVAGDLFAYIVSEDVTTGGNTAMSQMYDNISGHINTARKPYAANYNYLSVGSAILEIPYTEITTLVAAKVFKKLEPIFTSAPTRELFNKDLFSMELTPDHLKGYITREVMANPISGNQFTYGDIWPNNGVYLKAYEWLNSHAQLIVRKNKSNFVSVYEGKIITYLEKLIKDPAYGPCYASKLLLSNDSFNLIRTLEGYRDDCRERLAGCAARGPGLKNQMDQSFNSGKNISVLLPIERARAAKNYVPALEAWLSNEYGYWYLQDLADALTDLIGRLQKYYDRIFKNLLESISLLPDIFAKNVTKIETDEREAQAHPDKVKNILIRPLEFERRTKQTLDVTIDSIASAFLQSLGTNLRKIVGLELGSIDSDVVISTDISGFIADFINDNFGRTLDMNMDNLLLEKLPAGQADTSYLRQRLDELRDSAVPLYHTDVVYAGLDTKTFSLISIPNDCPKLWTIANRDDHPTGEQPKRSAERSKMQWVKVIAGVPLFAFPEVSRMEQAYETAMITGRDTRKGVHLRYEWREQLPSPLPEATWPKDVVNSSEKSFSKAYNEKARAAFNRCVEGGVIRFSPANGIAKLYIADESQLDKLELHGSIGEKKDKLDMLKSRLWSEESTAVTLNPFGSAADGPDDLKNRVCENTIRFSNLVDEILRQDAILSRFASFSASFDNVEYYVKAVFADLVYKQGFSYKFKRSELDYSPIVLVNTMDVKPVYLDFELNKAFSGNINADIRDNVKAQFDRAQRSLINSDGDFIPDAINAMRSKLSAFKTRCADDAAKAQAKLEITPIDQRGDLENILDFYAKAIELTSDLLTTIS